MNKLMLWIYGGQQALDLLRACDDVCVYIMDICDRPGMRRMERERERKCVDEGEVRRSSLCG